MELKEDDLTLIVSPVGGNNIAMIYQEAKLYHGKLKNFAKELDPQKSYWIQVFQGIGKINEHEIIAGDGVALNSEKQFIPNQ